MPFRGAVLHLIKARNIMRYLERSNAGEMDWAVWFVLDFLVGKKSSLFSLILNYYWYFADTELHPSQSPHQNRLLTEPSGFKRFPKPQGWTVTVSHKNLTHSSRGVSRLLQPLLITRGQSEAVPECVCLWLLSWEVVCFDLHISYCCQSFSCKLLSLPRAIPVR